MNLRFKLFLVLILTNIALFFNLFLNDLNLHIILLTSSTIFLFLLTHWTLLIRFWALSYHVIFLRWYPSGSIVRIRLILLTSFDNFLALFNWFRFIFIFYLLPYYSIIISIVFSFIFALLLINWINYFVIFFGDFIVRTWSFGKLTD